jgi:predicted DNA-binding transcriptional regulator YafY
VTGRPDIRAIPDELLTRQELADRMRVSVATVDRLRKLGMPVVRFSPGRVCYRANEAMMWAEDRFSEKRKAA